MKLRPNLFALLAAAAALVPAVQAQITVPESFALPSSSVDRTKPGFKVRTFQATRVPGELPNSTSRAESQIAGLLLQADGTPYANIADLSAFNADGTYDEANAISYAAGTIPGIPGSEGNDDNIALEAITYVELAVGTYAMVVNSDDGFKVTVGDVRDRIAELKLGEYDGGRGAGDTVFEFKITKAGIYPFRLVYYEGGGGNSVDWFTASPGDPTAADRVLLNNGTIPAFRALSNPPTLGPAINGVSPLPGSINQGPRAGLTALILDGSTAFNQASLKVTLNGVDVTASTTVSKPAGSKTTKISYVPTTMPQGLSFQEYKLTFDDPTAAGGKREAVIKYQVGAFANFNLPAPIWYENFDGVEQGALPNGWTTWSPIEGNGVYDLDDPSSDAYLVWVVISKQRVQDLSARWDANRRIYTPEAYINGERVQSLINTNFAYHESDTRGGSQYAELISPAVNLTGKTDINLVYNSIYEQNQDNIAGVEYSIDDGKTWMPVVYMVDVADIVKLPDGTADADATLNATNDDTADYTDPNTGELVGNTYGSFVKAPKTEWKNYNAYISGRINDDPQESKRIEKFRLPQADNQAKVRLRFFQAGTGSWYFGVDNVGLYSIVTIDPPSLKEQPADATRFVGSPVSFKVVATGQELAYQWQKDQADIPGATSDTLTIASVTHADAGKYRAIVKNPGGQVITTEATLTVQDVSGDASSLKNGLAVYLPFDGNLNDASGNNRNGTANGTLEYAAGRVGSGAVRVKNSRANSSYNFVTLGAQTFGDTKDFTVGFWMRSERVDGDPSVVANKNWGSGNNIGWTIGTQTDGRLEWNYRRTGVDGLSRKDLDLANQGLAANTWHHVVVSWAINGSAVSYVDGIEVNSTAIAPGTGLLNDPALALNIGEDGTGAYTDGEWDGLIDDLAVWERTLTPAEVGTLYVYGFAGGGSGTSPTLAYTVNRAAQQLTLTWEGSGFVLEETAALGTAWAPVSGAGANSATVSTASGNKFYRLKK